MIQRFKEYTFSFFKDTDKRNMFFIAFFSFIYFFFFAYKGPIIHDDSGWIRVLEETLSGNWTAYRGLWALQYMHLLGYLIGGKSIHGIYLVKTFLFSAFAVLTYWFFSLFIQKKTMVFLATISILFHVDILYSFYTTGSTTDLYIFFEMIAVGILMIYIHKTIHTFSQQNNYSTYLSRQLPWYAMIFIFCFISSSFKETGVFSFVIVCLSFITYTFLFPKYDATYKRAYIFQHISLFISAIFCFLLALQIYKLSNGYVPLHILQNLNVDLIYAFIQRAILMNKQLLITMTLSLAITFVCVIYNYISNKEETVVNIRLYLQENFLLSKIILILGWAAIIVLLSPLFPTFDPRYVNAHLFLVALFAFTCIGSFLDICIICIKTKMLQKALYGLFIIWLLVLCIPQFFHGTDFLLHLKNEYISINNVESYIETVDSNALVLYQAGTHDLGNWIINHTLKNEYKSPGWDQELIINITKENTNRTIYLVEYPSPWYVTLNQLEPKALVKTIYYWPVEIKIYVYNASTEKIDAVTNRNYPLQGPLFFYYHYDAEQRKIFKMTNKINFILGSSTVGFEKEDDSFSFFDFFKLLRGFKIREKEFLYYEP